MENPNEKLRLIINNIEYIVEIPDTIETYMVENGKAKVDVVLQNVNTKEKAIGYMTHKTNLKDGSYMLETPTVTSFDKIDSNEETSCILVTSEENI